MQTQESERDCPACDTRKPITAFPKNPGCVGGREPRCLECRKAGRQRPGLSARSPKAKTTKLPVLRDKAIAVPVFMTVAESYVINADGGADPIALTAEELDELVAWWTLKRKKAA